jgi:hypothetical protein
MKKLIAIYALNNATIIELLSLIKIGIIHPNNTSGKVVGLLIGFWRIELQLVFGFWKKGIIANEKVVGHA